MAKLVKLILINTMMLALISGGLPSCAKSTPSFQEQRTKVVQFLKQLNQASNNFEDASKAADISGKLSRGNLLEINSALTILLQQIEGYQRQINEISPPSEMSELIELKSAEQKSATKFYQTFQQLRSAIQSGSDSAFNLRR